MIRANLHFFKMSGSGNDFVVIDNRDGRVAEADYPGFTRAVCRRGVSIGADGIVAIEPVDPEGPDADFRWRYFNADGSEGEMCGNGAMCGARFAVLHGAAGHSCSFQTMAGIVRATVAADPDSPIVTLAMVEPGPVTRCPGLTVARRSFDLYNLIVGVPHTVLFTEDADADFPGADLVTIGRAIRHHAHFPDGTNVNVVSRRSDGSLRMRTYERGVENETLACGTGSVATAVVATSLGYVTPEVSVVTSGGPTLRVDFAWDGLRATGVTLTGEARIVAGGTIHPDAFA